MWAELPVAWGLSGCQRAWLLLPQKTTRKRHGGGSHSPAAFETPFYWLLDSPGTDPETRIQVPCFIWEEVISGNISGEVRQGEESS